MNTNDVRFLAVLIPLGDGVEIRSPFLSSAGNGHQPLSRKAMSHITSRGCLLKEGFHKTHGFIDWEIVSSVESDDSLPLDPRYPDDVSFDSAILASGGHRAGLGGSAECAFLRCQ